MSKNILLVLSVLLIELLNCPASAQQKLKPEVVVQTGGGYPIAISPNNQFIASVANTIKIWDSASAKELTSLQVGDLEVMEAVFSPDNRYLAVYKHPGIGDFGSLDLWDVKVGKRVWTTTREVAWSVASINFSPDGKYINLVEGMASHEPGSADTSVQQYNARTGVGPRNVGLSTLSSDRKVQATVRGKLITVFNVQTKKNIQITSENIYPIHSISLDEYGRVLAVSNSNSVSFWNVAEKRIIKKYPITDLLENVLAAFPDNDSRKTEVEDIANNNEFTEIHLSPDGSLFELELNYWDRAGRNVTTLYFKASSGKAINLLSDTAYSVCKPIHNKDWTKLIFNGCKESIDDGVKFFFPNNDIIIWDRTAKKEIATLKSYGNTVLSVDFINGQIITRDENGIRIWGDKITNLNEKEYLAISPDLKLVVNHGEIKSEDLREEWENLKRSDAEQTKPEKSKPDADPPGSDIISLREVDSNKLIQTFIGHKGTVTSALFNRDGSLLISASQDGTIKVWDVNTGAIKRSYEIKEPVLSMHLGDKSDAILFLTGRNYIKLLNLKDGKISEIGNCGDCTLDGEYGEQGFNFNNVIDMSFDGSLAAFIRGRCLNGDFYWADIFNVKHNSEQFDWDDENKEWQKAAEGIDSVSFSPDGKTLAIGQGGCQRHEGAIHLFNVENKISSTLIGHKDSVVTLKFSPDGKFLLSGSSDYSAKLWDVPGKKLLATLFSLNKSDWVVVTPEGRFDTNESLDNIEGLYWRVPDQPSKPLPLDIFMRNYYEPRLLSHILKGDKLPEIASLAELNRVQPKVIGINVVKQEDESDSVTVKVKVRSIAGMCLKGGSHLRCESGVYDLRLYRDGQLVGQSPSPTVDTSIIIPIAQSRGRQLQRWRDISVVRTHEGRPITTAVGAQEITFTNIRLPQRSDITHVEFTAYAFNSDRVKSATSEPKVYPLKQPHPSVKRRAYVITVGVDATSNPSVRLGFAPTGAREIGDLLRKKLRSHYDDVVPVQLISEYKKGGSELRQDIATKNNIKTVLNLLSNQGRTDVQRQAFPMLQTATPDDLVILYIASHGYADPWGRFHLVPSDIGKSAVVSEELLDRCLKNSEQSVSCQAARDFLRHTISSDELTQWIQAIDAGQMVLILDSCHSGAVSGPGFKPGPMGDSSFGQLSYDKGMLVLAATQSEQLDYGPIELGDRSLLTDALINQEGQDQKQPFNLRMWLGHAKEQVPALYRKYVSPEAKQEQEPELFDFARKTLTIPGN